MGERETERETRRETRRLRVYISCACYDDDNDLGQSGTVTEEGVDPVTGEKIEIEVTWQSSNEAGAGDKFKQALQDNYDVVIYTGHANYGKAWDVESMCNEHTADFPVDSGLDEIAEESGDKDKIEGAPKVMIVFSCNSAVKYGGICCFRRGPVTKRVKKRMPDTKVLGTKKSLPFSDQLDAQSIVDALKGGTRPEDLNYEDHIAGHESEGETGD